MADDVRAAYDAPFPDERAKAGARAMPTLVPTRARRPGRPRPTGPRGRCCGACDMPFLVAFSDGDPITGGDGADPAQHVPGTRGLDHPTIAGAGHFLQEDAGDELGRVVAGFMRERWVTHASEPDRGLGGGQHRRGDLAAAGRRPRRTPR